jgi:hypothetical protein
MSSARLLVWLVWVDKEGVVELWEEEVNGNGAFIPTYSLLCGTSTLCCF